MAALARSANVTVEFLGEKDGQLSFVAWTEPESRYSVTFDPDAPGGWCKHCLGCLSHFAPWYRQLALGAGEALDEIKMLRTGNRALGRKIERMERRMK